jgi:hypothetical protein
LQLRQPHDCGTLGEKGSSNAALAGMRLLLSIAVFCAAQTAAVISSLSLRNPETTPVKLSSTRRVGVVRTSD